MGYFRKKDLINKIAMAKEKWISSPWTISIGSGIFSLLLTIGYDFIKAKPILSTIGTILKWFSQLFWTILNFELKVWWIISLLVLFVFIIYIIDKLRQPETLLPDFYSYTEDTFKKWKWTWKWKLSNSSNAWILSNMEARCPNCNTPLIDHSSSFSLNFACPRCDFHAYDHQCDEPQKVERIILDNIERRRKEEGKKNSP